VAKLWKLRYGEWSFLLPSLRFIIFSEVGVTPIVQIKKLNLREANYVPYAQVLNFIIEPCSLSAQLSGFFSSDSNHYNLDEVYLTLLLLDTTRILDSRVRKLEF
jgi:hypothetical protein